MSRNGGTAADASLNLQGSMIECEASATEESCNASPLVAKKSDSFAATGADSTATSYHTTATSLHDSQEVSGSRLECSGEELVFSDDNLADDNLDIHAEMSDDELSNSKNKSANRDTQKRPVQEATADAGHESTQAAEEPPKPKKLKTRRGEWGFKYASYKSAKAITSRMLDELLGDKKPNIGALLRQKAANDAAPNADLEEGEVKEEKVEVADDQERKPVEQVGSEDAVTVKEEVDEKKPELSAAAAAAADAAVKPSAEPTKLRETKVVDYQVDDPIRDGPPRDAKKLESAIVKLVGLVRPFTPNQLKDLLRRFGSLRDSPEEPGFWIDRIKTRCYATFETIEEAKKAREELDNCKWPRLNPKPLLADFATSEELKWALEFGNTGQQMPRNIARAGDIKQHDLEERLSSIEAHEDVIVLDDEDSPTRGRKRRNDADDGDSEEGGGSSKRQAANEASSRSKNSRRRQSPADQRERSGERARSRKSPIDRRLQMSPISSSPIDANARDRRETGKKNEPSKLLDKLFRKTVAAPYIYWLPLSDEQIAAKESQRRRREAADTQGASFPSPRRTAERNYTRLNVITRRSRERDRRRR